MRGGCAGLCRPGRCGARLRPGAPAVGGGRGAERGARGASGRAGGRQAGRQPTRPPPASASPLRPGLPAGGFEGEREPGRGRWSSPLARRGRSSSKEPRASRRPCRLRFRLVVRRSQPENSSVTCEMVVCRFRWGASRPLPKAESRYD